MAAPRLIIAVFGIALSLASSQAIARDFKIGGGITISLSDNWSGTFMQNPAMKFAGVKEMVDDATEARLRGQGSGVLVSYMKFKSDKPPSEIKINDGETVRKNAMQVYSAQAVETDPVATVRRDGDVVRAFVTLHAKPGSRFNVAGGYPGGCVTSGTIRLGVAVHSISIASDSCESAAHLEAVTAIFGPAQ